MCWVETVYNARTLPTTHRQTPVFQRCWSPCPMTTSGARATEVAGHRFTVHDQSDVVDPVTGRALTGSWLWPSAFVLSHYLATRVQPQFPLAGKSVIELGAGCTGLPGLMAARLGAARVVLTDVAPNLPGLMKSVEANCEAGDGLVEVRELLWGSEESAVAQLGGERFDIVLMSDVFYDAEEMDGLGRTLRFVSEEGTRVWAASEVRDWTWFCFEELDKHGYKAVELAVQLDGMGSEPGSGESDGEGCSGFAVYEIVQTGRTEDVGCTKLC